MPWQNLDFPVSNCMRGREDIRGRFPMPAPPPSPPLLNSSQDGHFVRNFMVGRWAEEHSLSTQYGNGGWQQCQAAVVTWSRSNSPFPSMFSHRFRRAPSGRGRVEKRTPRGCAVWARQKSADSCLEIAHSDDRLYRLGHGGGNAIAWRASPEPTVPDWAAAGRHPGTYRTLKIPKKRKEAREMLLHSRERGRAGLLFSFPAGSSSDRCFPDHACQPGPTLEDWLSIQPLSRPAHRRVMRCVGESCPVGGCSGWVGFLWSSVAVAVA